MFYIDWDGTICPLASFLQFQLASVREKLIESKASPCSGICVVLVPVDSGPSVPDRGDGGECFICTSVINENQVNSEICLNLWSQFQYSYILYFHLEELRSQ